jgi:hypothetical protein
VDESLCARAAALRPGDEVTVQFQGGPGTAVRVASLPRFGAIFQAEDVGGGAVKRGAPIVDAFTTSENPSRQYAASVVSASSARDGRPASAVLGAPDVPRYMSSASAWSPQINAAGGLETLVVELEAAVHVSSLVVHESYRPGYLVAVDMLLPSTGEWAAVWGADDIDSSLPNRRREFMPPLCPTAEPVRQVRLSYATGRAPEPIEVDAVEVWGVGALAGLRDVWVSDMDGQRLVYRPGQGAGVPLAYEDAVQYEVLSCRGLERLSSEIVRFDVVLTPELNQVAAAGAWLMIMLFGLLLLATVLSAGATVRFGKEPVVKGASVPFILAMTAGIALEFLYGVLYAANALSASASYCFYAEFIKGAAFCALFGSLLVKSWRLRKIFGQKVLRRVPITNAQLGLGLGALVMVDFAITAAQLAAGSPSLDRVTYGAEQVEECVYEHAGVWDGLHIAWRAAVIGTVVLLAYKNRNLPSLFNESRGVAFVAYNASFFFLLEAVMTPLVEGNPQAQAAVTAFSVIVIGLVALLVLVLQKFYIIFFKPEQNTSKNTTAVTATGTKMSSINGRREGSTSKSPSPSTPRGRSTRSAMSTNKLHVNVAPKSSGTGHTRLASPPASPEAPASPIAPTLAPVGSRGSGSRVSSVDRATQGAAAVTSEPELSEV